MYGLGLLASSDTAHLNVELNDLEWAATTQADAVRATELSQQAPAMASQVQESGSSGRAVEPLDSVLPANMGLHFLTLLSKTRPPVPELRSAASANADKAHQTSSAQVQSDVQPVDKTVKKREKNNRAQKRCRDRMRAKEEHAIQQIAALTAELRRSQQEKGLIEQRADTLSMALAVRATGSPELQAEGLHIQAGPNYQYWPESGWIPYAVLKNTLHLSNLSDCSAPQLMTAEQVKGMTVADHQDDWRLLVFRLAILIPETQGRLDTAAGSRLKEVMLEHGMRIACVASFNPSSFHTLTTSNMETRQHMGQMPAAAEFTEAQKRQIFRARRVYYQHCGVLTAARIKIAPWLQASGFQTTFPDMASQYVTSHSAMLQLQENLVHEQNLFLSLLGSVWRRTCTIMQTSIMMVQAYPLAVDLISVMNCLAEDAGEPTAGDLMAGYINTGRVIDSSSLRVPSPDLLLEGNGL